MKLLGKLKFILVTALTVLLGEFKGQQETKGGIVAREFFWRGNTRTVYLIRGVDVPPGTLEPRQ